MTWDTVTRRPGPDRPGLMKLKNGMVDFLFSKNLSENLSENGETLHFGSGSSYEIKRLLAH